MVTCSGLLLRGRGFLVAGAVFVTLAAVRVTGSQDLRPAVPPLAPESLVGSVSFDLYCASCHGRTGKGDGPAASSLRTRPADLTMLTARHGGTFPREQVLAFVDGSSRAAGAHGTSAMPVWGPTLRALEGSTARVSVRLQNLVAFIESIQSTPALRAAAPMSGADLYRAFCANCHGTSGRGDGVMSSQLRTAPPDLTRFAVRNGGVFPSQRVKQVIEGRGSAAHGDREMPVWGSIFKTLDGGSPDPATARIDALVRFLEGIQERRGE